MLSHLDVIYKLYGNLILIKNTGLQNEMEVHELLHAT